MGRLLPLLAVFIILGNGFHIFRDPANKDGYQGYLVPCTIFIFSTFLLLCEMKIYPRSMRRMGRIGQTIIEYLIASYLMENLLIDFWIPVEMHTIHMLANASQSLKEFLSKYDIECGPVCDILANTSTQIAISSLVSLFFLLSVLQAIRAIDFSQLRGGVGFFFKDIIFRLRWYFNKQVLKSLGLGNKKRVHISGIIGPSNQHIKKPNISKSGSPCQDECELSAEEYCHYHGDMYDNDSALEQTFSEFEMGLNENFK